MLDHVILADPRGPGQGPQLGPVGGGVAGAVAHQVDDGAAVGASPAADGVWVDRYRGSPDAEQQPASPAGGARPRSRQATAAGGPMRPHRGGSGSERRHRRRSARRSTAALADSTVAVAQPHADRPVADPLDGDRRRPDPHLDAPAPAAAAAGRRPAPASRGRGSARRRLSTPGAGPTAASALHGVEVVAVGGHVGQGSAGSPSPRAAGRGPPATPRRCGSTTVVGAERPDLQQDPGQLGLAHDVEQLRAQRLPGETGSGDTTSPAMPHWSLDGSPPVGRPTPSSRSTRSA